MKGLFFTRRSNKQIFIQQLIIYLFFVIRKTVVRRKQLSFLDVAYIMQNGISLLKTKKINNVLFYR